MCLKLSKLRRARPSRQAKLPKLKAGAVVVKAPLSQALLVKALLSQAAKALLVKAVKALLVKAVKALLVKALLEAAGGEAVEG